MPELTGWGQLTPWGAVLLMLVSFFVLLSRGKLYTGAQHLESIAAKDEIIEIHKSRGDKAEAAFTEQVRQNGLLVKQGEAWVHFINDADRVSQRTPRTGYIDSGEGPGHVRT